MLAEAQDETRRMHGAQPGYWSFLEVCQGRLSPGSERR
jgi:hypothetical protein